MTTAPACPIESVCGLVQAGVARVFDTMLSLKVEPAGAQDVRASGEPLVAAAVGFVGDVNGVVFIHVSADFARKLARRMLSLADAEPEGDEMVNDVLGELGNMIVGSVKSALCDSGARCMLAIPSIVRGHSAHQPGRFVGPAAASFSLRGGSPPRRARDET